MSRPCTLDTFGILMSIGALVALNCGAAETNAPTQATDAFVLEQERIHKDILFEKVFIPPDGVSAYVICMRAKANDIKPAVIVLHGGEAGTADKTQTIPWLWPIELARMGYLVVCTDAWGCGEHPGVRELREMKKTTLWDTLIPRVAVTARDNARVYEYLAARPDVDRARIGLMGVSGGALTALLTATMEDRFAAFVAINGLRDFLSPQWKGKLFWRLRESWDVETMSQELRNSIKSMDPTCHAEKIPQKPVLFVHGSHDQLAPPIFTKELYEKLLPLYRQHPERLAWKDFDVYPLPTHREPDMTELLATHAGHPAIMACAYEWLEKYVKNKGK